MTVIYCALFTSLPAWAKSGFDGPAELPRVSVASSMADTPAQGSIVAVNAGGDLQAALNNAFCGDIIELQGGPPSLANSWCRPRIATTNIGLSFEPVLRTALCPQKDSALRPATLESLLLKGVRNIPAPIQRT
jgi:hypothetical protein